MLFGWGGREGGAIMARWAEVAAGGRVRHVLCGCREAHGAGAGAGAARCFVVHIARLHACGRRRARQPRMHAWQHRVQCAGLFNMAPVPRPPPSPPSPAPVFAHRPLTSCVRWRRSPQPPQPPQRPTAPLPPTGQRPTATPEVPGRCRRSRSARGARCRAAGPACTSRGAILPWR